MEAQRLWYEYAYVLRGVLTPLFTDLPELPPGDIDDDYNITFIFYIINVFRAKTKIHTNVKVGEPGMGNVATMFDANVSDCAPYRLQ